MLTESKNSRFSSSELSRRRMHKGFQPSRMTLKVAKLYSETNIVTSLLVVSFYHLLIWSMSAFCIYVWTISPMPIAIIMYGLVIIMNARHIRALELMVHDGSHRNFYRSSERINHWLTNWGAAYWVGQDAESYWTSHKKHHPPGYNTRIDPDLLRYQELEIENWDRSNLSFFTRGLFVRLPKYVSGYYRAIGATPKILGKAIICHLLFCLAPLTIIFTPSIAIALWGAFWLLPMLGPLQVLRLIAESEEHAYTRGDTEFDTTINNEGLWHWIIHPYYDGWHIIHHMFPSIPQWRHKKFHALLRTLEPLQYGCRYWQRTRIVQNPTRVS